MAIDPEVLSNLRSAIADAAGWLNVATALEARVPEGATERYRPLIYAFGYVLVDLSHSDRRESAGGPFAAQMVYANGHRFPPAIEDVSREDVDVWSAGFHEIKDPVVTARLGDLLWIARAGDRPDICARAAVDAYIKVAAIATWHPVERAHCLTRALELARSLRDEERVRETAARIRQVMSDDLRAAEGVGISLTLGSALVGLAPELRPDLDELLQRVATVYDDDPHALDSVTDMRTRIAPADAREDLRRVQVQRWREAAKEGDGMLKMIRLERALDLARTHGLTAEADDLRRQLQEVEHDELDLKTIGTQIDVPSAQIDAFRNSFIQHASWETALTQFGAQPPPGGQPDELDAQVEEEKRQHPLQFLMTQVVVGPDRATAIFRAVDEASHTRLARSQRRGYAARFWSIFAADILDVIKAHYGVPPRDALAKFFAGSLIEPDIAERIGRAFELYWDGQPDESAHVLLPRLESVLRTLARRVGIPIVREPVGNEPGGVSTLGVLMRDLRGSFDDAGWHAYLQNLLVDPLGLNLRNTILHGLSGPVDRLDAALLLHAACYLRLLTVGPTADSPGEAPG